MAAINPVNVQPYPTPMDYIKNGKLYVDAQSNCVMVASVNDITDDVKAFYQPGTLFYTNGFKKVWQLGIDKELVVIV